MVRTFFSLCIAGSLSALSAPAQLRSAPTHRISYYYQTQYSNNVYVSLAPIWTNLNPATGEPFVTDLEVAAFHLGHNADGSPYIHLNNDIPQDLKFTTMWHQCAYLESLGITVRMMLGGAAQGSY